MRYFIVNYSAVVGKAEMYMGIVSVVMEDGKYINRKGTELTIKQNLNEGAEKVYQVTITNIIELTEEDYLSWYE